MSAVILFWISLLLTFIAGTAIWFVPEDNKPRMSILLLVPWTLLAATVVARYLGL